jgi:hypothetical protein
MPFEGHGLTGYDNSRKVFQSTWIDNMGTGITYMEGTFDPSTKMITFTGKMVDPMSGKNGDVKQTWKFVDDNNILLEMYSVQGGQDTKTMEIKLTRKS